LSALTNAGVARSRPTLHLLRPASALGARFNSSVPQEDPKTKAQALIDALPGNSLVSKAAILSAGAGVSVAAISNEIYVVNEETIVAFCLLTVMWSAFRYLGPSYVSWADSQRKKMGDLLNAARENHTESVKERIGTVNELSGVVNVTKNLFEVSKVGGLLLCGAC
jgi:F-type H+-transporting ATPase subunit b